MTMVMMMPSALPCALRKSLTTTCTTTSMTTKTTVVAHSSFSIASRSSTLSSWGPPRHKSSTGRRHHYYSTATPLNAAVQPTSFSASSSPLVVSKSSHQQQQQRRPSWLQAIVIGGRRLSTTRNSRTSHPNYWTAKEIGRTRRRRPITAAAEAGRRKSTAAVPPPSTSTTASSTTTTTANSTAAAITRPPHLARQTTNNNDKYNATSTFNNNWWRNRLDRYLNQTRVWPVPRWISPQRHTFAVSECFGNASFVLVAVSYAVDDFLHLRLLAIAGSAAMLVFTYFHPHGRVLWLPFKWNVMFIALNTWRVAMVYWERYRSNQLSPELCRIHDHHFYVLEKTDFARLVRLGTVEHFTKGQVLLAQGQDNRYVRLVLKGDLNVDRDGQVTYTLHEGNFISEVGLHAGLLLRGSVEGCGTVTADSDDVVVLTWDRTELMRLLELHKSIERSLKAVMSWDIVSKLKSQRALLASGRIKDPELWTEKRREQTLHRYKSILFNMLSHPEYLNKRKDELTKYRGIHHIEQSEHVKALKDMGWSVKEFEEGKKEGQLDADLLEKKKMGLKWWIQSWWNAL